MKKNAQVSLDLGSSNNVSPEKDLFQVKLGHKGHFENISLIADASHQKGITKSMVGKR